MFWNVRKALNKTIIATIITIGCCCAALDNRSSMIDVVLKQPFAKELIKNLMLLPYEEKEIGEVKETAYKVFHDHPQVENYDAAMKLFIGGPNMYALLESFIKTCQFSSTEEAIKSIDDLCAMFVVFCNGNKEGAERLATLSKLRLQTEGYRIIDDEYQQKKDKTQWKKIILTKYISEYVLNGKINGKERDYDLSIFFS